MSGINMFNPIISILLMGYKTSFEKMTYKE